MKHLTSLLLAIMLLVMSTLLIVKAESGERLTVYVVNYPLKYFAERIAGEYAMVVFPAPPDIDPAFWFPEPEIVKAYQNADIILLNGATYAKWTMKVTLPQFRIVNTSKNFQDSTIKIIDAITHSHGMDRDHSHSGTAFTTWLDFSQANMQAEAIQQVLSRKVPEKTEVFQKNYRLLEKDLLALDGELEKLTAGKSNIPLLASHPVYQYFSRRYKLNLESVMWEPDQIPSEAQWEELEYGLKTHPAKWMIWEGDPHPDSIRKLEKLGVRSVVFNPCGNVPENGDFLTIMKQNVENLRIIFK